MNTNWSDFKIMATELLGVECDSSSSLLLGDFLGVGVQDDAENCLSPSTVNAPNIDLSSMLVVVELFPEETGLIPELWLPIPLLFGVFTNQFERLESNAGRAEFKEEFSFCCRRFNGFNGYVSFDFKAFHWERFSTGFNTGIT
ncbi:hypothetical protein L1887_16365 [Cichorium endivia]|nr:hypothetical protein L1887_16365 [Cichorium endivia]